MALAPLQLRVAGKLACRACHGELAHEFGPPHGLRLRCRRRGLAVLWQWQAARGGFRPEGEHAQDGHDKTAVLVGRKGELLTALECDLVVGLHRLRIETRGEIEKTRALRLVVERAG